MIILPDQHIPRAKILLPIPDADWRSPSQSQPKNMFGHENQTRFRVRALTHDGMVRWVGWYDDRDDFDAVLWAIANNTLRFQREIWDLTNETWMPGYGYSNVGWRPDFADLIYDFVTTVFITSGTSTVIPADCFTVGTGSEFLDCIGAGGSGGAFRGGASRASGAGGGAWARAQSITLTPNSTVTIQVGAGGPSVNSSGTATNGNSGTDTWFNGASFAASVCGAKAGILGPAAGANTTGGAGGAEASCRGGSGGSTTNPGTSFARSGGKGADCSNSGTGGGGGGTGGPSGNGVAGTNNATLNSGSGGGAGDNGSGGAGSAGGTGGGSSNGGAGTEYDSSHGSGGGSGGCFVSSGGTSGAGGVYGAGSGGSSGNVSGTSTSSKGGDGLIVLRYTPFTPLAGLIWDKAVFRRGVVGY